MKEGKPFAGGNEFSQKHVAAPINKLPKFLLIIVFSVIGLILLSVILMLILFSLYYVV